MLWMVGQRCYNLAMPMERNIAAHMNPPGGKPDAMVQQLKYTQVPEKPAAHEVLEVRPLAWQVAQQIESIFNSSTPDKVRTRIEEVLQERIETETIGINSMEGGVMISYGQVRDRLKADESGTLALSDDDREQLKKVREDLVVGVALAVEMGKVGGKPYEQALMEAVILDRDDGKPGRIDGMIGVEPLFGAGVEAAKLVITDVRLRNTLGMLNGVVTTEGKIPYDTVRRAQGSLEDMVIRERDLPADEAQWVLDYLRWAAGEEPAEAAAAAAAATGPMGGGVGGVTGGPTPEEMSAMAHRERNQKLEEKYFRAMFTGPTPDSTNAGTTFAPEWQDNIDNDTAQDLINLNNFSYLLCKTSGIEELVGRERNLWRAKDKTMNYIFNETPGVQWLFHKMLHEYFQVVPEANSKDYFNLRFKGDWEGSGKNKEWKIVQSVLDDFANLDSLFNKWKNLLIDNDQVNGGTPRDKELAAAKALGFFGGLMRVSMFGIDANPSGSYGVGTLGRNQVWNANYPEAKGLQKFDADNPWADAYGDWLRLREQSSKNPNSKTHDMDVEFMKAWKVDETIHPLPERMLVNYFTTTKVYVAEGPFSIIDPVTGVRGKKDDSTKDKQVSMLYALWMNWKIDYTEMEKDSWIGYHDVVGAAATMFGYIKSGRDQELDFHKNWSSWASGINKAWIYLKKNKELEPVFRSTRIGTEDHSPLAERIMWFMGACAGGFADTPELVIAKGAETPPSQDPQSRGVMSVVDSDAMCLMLDEKDRHWIAKRVHAFWDVHNRRHLAEHERSWHERRAILAKAAGLSYHGKLKLPTLY